MTAALASGGIIAEYYRGDNTPVIPNEEPLLKEYLRTADFPTLQAVKPGFADALKDFINDAS